MKSLRNVILVTLLSFSRLGTGQAANVTLEWDPSPDPDVASFNLYYGGFSQEYANLVAVALPNQGLALVRTLPD